MNIIIAKVSDMPLADIWQGLQTGFDGVKHVRALPAKDLTRAMTANPLDLVVLPGITGEASPYPRLFEAEDRRALALYLSSGGRVLGVCAGAYFMADLALYDFGNKSRYQLRDSMGQAFHGAAFGPLQKTDNDQYVKAEGHDLSEIWTVATHYPQTGQTLHTPYGKGPAFIPFYDARENVDVLARYIDQPNQPAAAVSMPVGKRGRAVLTGVLPYMLPSCPENLAAWRSIVAPLRKDY